MKSKRQILFPLPTILSAARASFSFFFSLAAVRAVVATQSPRLFSGARPCPRVGSVFSPPCAMCIAQCRGVVARLSFSCPPLVLNVVSGRRILLLTGRYMHFAWNVAWGRGYWPSSLLGRSRRTPAGPVSGRTSVKFLRSASRPGRARWTPSSEVERYSFSRRKSFWPRSGEIPPFRTPDIAIWSNYGTPLQLPIPGNAP